MLTRHRDIEPFAVEDTAVQMVWSELPEGPVVATVGRIRAAIDHPGGPGAIDISGLAPAAPHAWSVSHRGETVAGGSLRTLTSPPGPELFRFATLSDLHLGMDCFGLTGALREALHPDVDPFPVRCGQSALREAAEWGARAVVVKGDLVNTSSAENWALAAAVIGASRVPVRVLPGNHEVNHHAKLDPWEGAGAVGIDLVREVDSWDLEGVRLVLVNSAVPTWHAGRVSARRAGAADAVAGGGNDRPSIVLLHHQLHHRSVNLYLPPGIPLHDSAPFAHDLTRAGKVWLASSGHTHRHRRTRVEGLTCTEVGSTKDYPGVWAGYAVHEGGVRQVVRRISSPGEIGWTQRTRVAVGGVWGHWSPGRLDDRCFTVGDPSPARPTRRPPELRSPQSPAEAKASTSPT